MVKEDGRVIADLATEGASFVAAEGGEGGKGNVWFTTPEFRSPMDSTEGALGVERIVEVELQTIADVGMVKKSYMCYNKTCLRILLVRLDFQMLASQPF